MNDNVLGLGAVQITGEPDSGKTTTIITSGARPEEIFMIDDDVKGVAMAEELKRNGTPLGGYVNFVEETDGMRETDIYKHFVSIVDSIPKGKYKVIGIDNWSRIENTFHSWVENNPKLFREKWSPNGKIKGAQFWQSSFALEAQIINKLCGLAELVIFTTHLKNSTIGGIRTGKMKPDDKKALVQKASMRVWLRNNPESPKPIGVILKRIGKRVVTNDGIEVVNVLPRKMIPFTWQEVRRYWDEPFGNKKPSKEQTLDEHEISILADTLTEDQKMVLEIALKYGDGEGDDDGSVVSEDKVEKILEMKSAGIAIPQISSTAGVSIADVINVIRENK